MRTHRLVPALDDRYLRDDAFDAPVQSPDRQDVPPAVGDPPYGDPLRIEQPLVGIKVADGIDGASIVGDLLPRIQVLTGLPVTGAQMPVVEDERRHAFPQEVL